MKVAILVTGNTRNLYDKWKDYVFPLLSDLKNCDITFFYQVWSNDNLPDQIKTNPFVLNNDAFEKETITVSDLGCPSNTIEISQKSIYEEIKKFINDNTFLSNSKYNNLFTGNNDIKDYATYVDFCNYYSQPYAWMKSYNLVCEYENSNNTKFDYILKIRYDSFFDTDFKEVVTHIDKMDADILLPSYSTWDNFKLPRTNIDDVLPNGISDQWFVIKKSEKTDMVMNKLLSQMFITNHQTISLFGRRMAFEQCLYVSLISLNMILTTKFYKFILMRKDFNFEHMYDKFISENFAPSYSHAQPVILNSNLLKTIADSNL